MAPQLVQFIRVWQHLNKRNLDALDGIYAKDLQFQDPFEKISGRKAFKEYMKKVYAGVLHCSFEFHETYEKRNRAALVWTMVLKHERLSRHLPIKVQGMTEITFGKNKIKTHRDYFDSVELLYDHIPVVGSLLRLVRWFI